MGKKCGKLAAIIFIVCCLYICLCSNVFAYSSEEVVQNLNLPYASFYDNDNNMFCALFSETLGKSNLNTGTKSLIGADMYPEGSQSYFRLPYGSVLPGMIIYYTYQHDRGFVDSDTWWDFFNSYIQDETNRQQAFQYANTLTNVSFTYTDYYNYEVDINKYAFQKDVSLVFSEDFVLFLYRYSYRLLYNSGMFTGSYDEFVADSYKIVSSINFVEDISFNPNYYADTMYSLTIPNATSDYIPINSQFQNYAYSNNFWILGSLFQLINSDIMTWLPSNYIGVITSAILAVISVTTLMFVKKIVPGA